MELLTAAEVAERLRIQPATVLGWARDGVIPSLRLSHKVLRFEWPAVVEALKQNQRRRGGDQ